jgi:Leucine-rich repeat (LRR) protein
MSLEKTYHLIRLLGNQTPSEILSALQWFHSQNDNAWEGSLFQGVRYENFKFVKNTILYPMNAYVFLSLLTESKTDIAKRLCEEVTSLNMIGQGLINLPPKFAALKNLEKLYLRGNPIAEFPSEIFALPHLKVLDISANLLTSIPEGIKSIPLVDLYTDESCELPNGVTSERSLFEEEDRDYLDDEDYEDDIDDDEKSNSDIEVKFPSSISSLMLDGEKETLSWGELTYMGPFPDGKEFLDFVNELESILSHNPMIEVLILNHLDLHEVPRSISTLKNLSFLDLSHNKIKQVPSFLDSLIKLKEFGISDNQLEDFDCDFSKVINLETLSARGNLISEIPKSIYATDSLSSLDLRKNRISDLPNAIWSLPNLHSLSLQENPIEEITSQCLKSQSLHFLELPLTTMIPESVVNAYQSKRFVDPTRTPSTFLGRVILGS